MGQAWTLNPGWVNGAPMQLSEKEKTVLHAIEHRAITPISEIEKRTRLRAHTIRYCINSMQERGLILGKAPFINAYPLGYTDYTLYFSLAAQSARSADELFAACEKSDGVSWVASLGGEYQAGVAICATRVEEVAAFLHGLSKKFGEVFFQKSISVRVRFCAFGRKYLSKTPAAPIALAVELSGQRRIAIDQTDHLILGALANRGFMSQRQLARELGMPFSTVERRIALLEKSGIIAGYIYRLNLAEANLQSYRLLLSSRGMSDELSGRLYNFAAHHPQVLHFVECMGAWDYEMGVEVERSADVTAIVRALYEQFGNSLNSVKFLQIFQHRKYSAYPFTGTLPSFD